MASAAGKQHASSCRGGEALCPTAADSRFVARIQHGNRWRIHGSEIGSPPIEGAGISQIDGWLSRAVLAQLRVRVVVVRIVAGRFAHYVQIPNPRLFPERAGEIGRTMLDLLVISPHPDDAELGMGGAILRLQSEGLRVGVLDLTDGEPTPHGSPEIRAKET